ncbi:MAG: acyltransferase [Pseudomonadota bacterium]|nr:acyltransferase [Pseudomonadota bacterium]
METKGIDFLLTGCATTLLLLLDWLLLALLLVPLTRAWFGDHHVVVDALLFLLLYGLLSGLLFRLCLRFRPLRPGDYAMDDAAFTYWKFLTMIYEFGRGALLPFTTVVTRPLVALLFGARVGREIALGGRLADPPLIHIGDYAVLGHNSVLTPHAITSGKCLLREIRIGNRATVGVNVVVMPGVEIGDGAVVTAGSVVTMSTRIPPGELWGGVPARKLKDIAPTDIRA